MVRGIIPSTFSCIIWSHPMEKRDPIQEQFERFHASHSEIYAEFRHIALNLLQYGRSHYESKAILKVIRYHRALSGKSETELFKINNNYSLRYARKLMEEDDQLRTFLR
jgi:hypothetical protein